MISLTFSFSDSTKSKIFVYCNPSFRAESSSEDLLAINKQKQRRGSMSSTISAPSVRRISKSSSDNDSEDDSNSSLPAIEPDDEEDEYEIEYIKENFASTNSYFTVKAKESCNYFCRTCRPYGGMICCDACPKQHHLKCTSSRCLRGLRVREASQPYAWCPLVKKRRRAMC